MEFQSNRLTKNLGRQKVAAYFPGLASTPNFPGKQELMELWSDMCSENRVRIPRCYGESE